MTCNQCGMTVGWDCECDPEYNALINEGLRRDAIEVPRHCGPGVPAPCSCMWESGSWTVCNRHRTPHVEHTPEDAAPWCPDCTAGERSSV